MAPGRHDPEQSGSQMADAIRLTIDELATLQGFPPGYIFTGTKTAQAKQVGNAVPPALARVLVEANLPSALEVAA
jgi:DNA (cytosine-5)-methyltransferase 1